MRRTLWLGAALATLLAAPLWTAQADLGPPFASADGKSDLSASSDASFLVTGPVDPVGHTTYLARVTITGGNTLFYGNAGAVWWDFPPQTREVLPGTAPQEPIICEEACAAHVDWFDVPTAPVTFSGAITEGADGASDIGFIVPIAGNYHADVSLAGGSVIFYGPGNCPNFSPIPAAVSGRIELGHLAAGSNNFCILAPSNSGGIWTATIARDPVTVSLASPAQSIARSGTSTNVSFTASDSGAADELVQRADTNQTVRTLAVGAAVAAGLNNVAWNGLDDHGNPVPDGQYRVMIESADDRTIETDAKVTIDNTKPNVVVNGRRLASRSGNVRILASDAGGISHALISAAGTTTTVLRFGRKGLAYHPRGGWHKGPNTLRVTVVDLAGNKTVTSVRITTPSKARR